VLAASSLIDVDCFLIYCRRYVEKELSFEIGHLPEKHDLSYYPTIHDLQNHIHKALQDIKDGILPFTSNAVSVCCCPTEVVSKIHVICGSLFHIFLRKDTVIFSSLLPFF